MTTTTIDNLRQRHQEDCQAYPNLYLTLVFGLGKAVVYFIVFSISLIYNFSWVYLLIMTLYTIISTWIAHKVARPLIKLNYDTQQAEATYRDNLTQTNLERCISIMFGLASNTKRLSYFQTFYGQIAVILPICLCSPSYFMGALSLGALMQATGIMSTITDNLGFGITSFNDINKFRSCRARLKEAGIL